MTGFTIQAAPAQEGLAEAEQDSTGSISKAVLVKEQQTALWESATRKTPTCRVHNWLCQVGVKEEKHLSAVISVRRLFSC